MLVLALEALARLVSPGFHYPGLGRHDDNDDSAKQRVLDELAEFMKREHGLVDLDRIGFLADQAQYDLINKAAGEALFPSLKTSA